MLLSSQLFSYFGRVEHCIQFKIFIFEVKPLHSHIIIGDKRDKVNNRDKSTLEIVHSVHNIKQQISQQL